MANEILDLAERRQRAENELTQIRLKIQSVSIRHSMFTAKSAEGEISKREEWSVNATNLEIESAIEKCTQPSPAREREVE